jgi:hypothetical protein
VRPDLETALKWLAALGPTLVALAVFFLTYSYNRWQVRLAKQKLRHDLYDRRFRVYLAFQELLLALPEKDSDEIKAAHRKASIARLEAPFLLDDDPKIQAYLEQLCAEVSKDVIANMMFFDAVKSHPVMMNDPEGNKDAVARASRLGMAKLEIPNRRLPELPQHFAPFLKLTDFWK